MKKEKKESQKNLTDSKSKCYALYIPKKNNIAQGESIWNM